MTVRELALGAASVRLVVGEPIDHPNEALYVAVNAHGILAAGFGGAIRIAAGGDIERELRAQAPLLVGEAYLTGPGRLAEQGVEVVAFGVTAPAPGQAPRRQASARALTSALRALDARRARSVTFPEVATRVEGLGLAEAARILADALAAQLRRGSSLDLIVVAGLHDEYLRRLRDALIAHGATAR